MIDRICIIGVGLIGGSLARALRAAGAVGEIVGASRNESHLREAVELGVIDRYNTDAGAAVAGADMIVLAVPVGAMSAVCRVLDGRLADNAVLTDAGSAKGSVIAAVSEALGELPANFVPGHPIAGTEQSGVSASFAELYRGRRVILTPLEHTDKEATARVRAMWQAAGAEVSEMTAAHHDEVLAATSHLPHLLAFALVESLARLHDKKEIFEYAAGGFSDFTRIASSDPVMWRDICIANRDAVLAMLERFDSDMLALTDALKNGDAERLLEVFTAAKTARDRFTEDREAGDRT